MDGLVSKLSERLQQAAFNNSALEMLITFSAPRKDLEVALILEVSTTSSKVPLDINKCLMTALGFVTVIVSVV